MKYFLILAFITVCGLTYANPCIIIEKVGGTYRVTSYTDKDGTPTVAIYKTVDELAKVTPVIAKSISGFSKDSDRIIIYFNEDDTINRIDCQVLSADKAEALQSKVVKNEELAEEAKTDIETLKADVKSK